MSFRRDRHRRRREHSSRRITFGAGAARGGDRRAQTPPRRVLSTLAASACHRADLALRGLTIDRRISGRPSPCPMADCSALARCCALHGSHTKSQPQDASRWPVFCERMDCLARWLQAVTRTAAGSNGSDFSDITGITRPRCARGLGRENLEDLLRLIRCRGDCSTMVRKRCAERCVGAAASSIWPGAALRRHRVQLPSSSRRQFGRGLPPSAVRISGTCSAS